ncbi:restriction endonuclease subunit S [Nitrosomonas sp.]|uniref:restriction endonuclease subunit S n=1 Tax=Nitrosomonas sp. TaxID=42353 RepID=UPI00272F6D03|nr:restriction endonuclease subunit S [Nitrosomonas sp.]MDP2224405.1 restriction endonuclease subunit S [Nitrosomonas sp.]
MAVRPGYKQTEVGVIPQDWEPKQLRKISPSQSVGLVINPSTYVVEDGTVPMLVGSNISANSISLEGARHISAASNQLLPASRLNAGDLVTVRVGEPGITAVVPPEIDGCNCASVMIVRKHTSFDSRWLCHVMNSRQGLTQVENVQYGTAQKQFNISDAINFTYATPPLPEQRAIAAALSDVDALLAKLDQLIAKKRDLKQAAMQQLLTGQTRLPGFCGEWSPIKISKHASLKARIGWQALTTAEYLDEGANFLVTGTDFVDGRVNWSSCHYVDQWRYDQDRNIQLRDGDVLLTKDGTIGKVGYVDGLCGPATLNSGVFVIRPLQESFAPLFLFYILKSKVFDEFLAMTTAGSTIVHLYQKDFVTFEFLAPSRDEQTAIATVLSDIDAELAALEARRDKTSALKQGMMQELLTGRIRLV